ncbi:glycosyltransferase [Enterococcus sp. 22-H-5-01]|uniref:glycosyltransferase n=1 Tax=Enterococcus sp. 22-H-5-01 TaxID=3418555 RepID=UPI003D026B88
MKDLKEIFVENNYKIVHSHINSLSVIPLRVAKKCRIPVRIAHNHSTAAPGEYKKNLMKYILRFFSTIYPTHYMSPTRYAGEWLFGEKVANNELFVLKNAISVEKFAYNETVRKKIREELHYSEVDFVIGNIGRLVWQKNQKFVIDVFAEVKKTHPNAKLLIVGDGSMKEELIEHAKNMKIFDNVLFLPNSPNVQNYYQAMDFFLFPSNYEGLGMVAIEAQVSGLPVLGSTMIPEDVNITELYEKVNLEKNVTEWAKHVVKPSKKRFSHLESAREAGYEISESVNELEKMYSKYVSQTKK